MSDATRSRSPRRGILIGCVMTGAGIAAFLSGVYGPLDRFALDLHFRELGAIQPDPSIVCIDIDDSALRSVGDWPWPRRRHAQIVQTLSELGARAIVLDLVLAEPSTPRSAHAGMRQDYDLDTLLVERGVRDEDEIIYDDDELHDAIRAAGNVYLAAYSTLVLPGKKPFDPNVSTAFGPQEISIQENLSDGIRQTNRSIRRAMVSVLMSDFGLDHAALVARLTDMEPVSAEDIERNLPFAKRHAARHRARVYVATNKPGRWPSFLAEMLPRAPSETRSADRADLIQAFREALSYDNLMDRSNPVPATLTERLSHAVELTLPLYKFAQAAKGIGLVSFDRTTADGTVRAVPLIMQAGNRFVLQLGFSVALDQLGLDVGSAEFDGIHLVLGRADTQRRIALDARGETLINWHSPGGNGSWTNSFTHIPVSRLLQVALNREAMSENLRRLRMELGNLMRLRHGDTPGEFERYARLVHRRRAIEKKLSRRNEIEPLTGDAPAVEDQIRQMEAEALTWLVRAHQLWSSANPITQEEQTRKKQVLDTFGLLGGDALQHQTEVANKGLADNTQSLLTELEPKIRDHTCLVGYTASAQADLVATPVSGGMPGVMAHANVINMLLQDKPAQRLSTSANLALLLIGGLCATWLAATQSPKNSALCLVGGLVILFICSALAFRLGTYHVASGVVGVQSGLTWALVTTYRYFFEERSRRQFQAALAQYTSPAVAAQISSTSQITDLLPQPAEVTCFFSDLQDFTSLSERLGPARTRDILNPYLETMSDLLVAHHAIINKFMGDGIFAFFNAPIWKHEDHAASACRCALAAQAALHRLNDRRADGQELVMRIGLSTGSVFVGDYGSPTKLDYTCIGDVVNLGARLERLSKVLGTQLLVDRTTMLGTGDEFFFRPMGRFVIAGRSQPAEVLELLGESNDVDSPVKEATTHFETAIRHFQGCQWGLCLEALDAYDTLAGSDDASRIYRRAAYQHQQSSRDENWDGAIDLSVLCV